MKGKKVTRNVVIQTLIKALKPLGYVHAFYESGAVAFNRVDEWSDIDLYLVVDDERVKDAFEMVETALTLLSPINQKVVVSSLPWPGISQTFYRLEETSEYLLIDLAVIKLSGSEKFLTPQIHGNAVFYFNKSNRVKVPILREKELIKTLKQKRTQLTERFAMFNIFIQKEINRGNYLEGLILYQQITLGSIVDALRMKFSPFHHDFKTRYVQYDLPKQLAQRLERLYFVRDRKDLLEKYQEATQWFNEIIIEPF